MILPLKNAVKYLVKEKNPLIESLINKLEDDQQLCNLLYRLLFQGEKYLFSAYDATIQSAVMYGFVKNSRWLHCNCQPHF